MTEQSQPQPYIAVEEPTYCSEKKESTAKPMKILLTVAGVCCFFMVIEIIGGYIANSLAILSDAAHLFTDISGFLISIFSIWITSMKPNKKMTYGYYRAEIIGAMASTILIWGLTAWLIVAAVARIHNPEPIDAKLMIIISCLGLCFNLIMMKILDDGQGESPSQKENQENNQPQKIQITENIIQANQNNNDNNNNNNNNDIIINNNNNNKNKNEDKNQGTQNMNVRAAFVHVIGDTIQSIGVVVAAVIIYLVPGSEIADPIVTFCFGVIVFSTTIPITRDCVAILMEGTPEDFELDKFQLELKSIPNVSSVHHLHVWSLSRSTLALSCHIITENPTQTLDDAVEIAKKYGIDHPTIQIELAVNQNA